MVTLPGHPHLAHLSVTQTRFGRDGFTEPLPRSRHDRNRVVSLINSCTRTLPELA